MANTKITNPELFNLGGATSTTYNITVQNVGGNKYFSNGTQQPIIGLVIGTQYIINQDDASNSSHPLILSTSSVSSGVYSTGVEYSLNGAVVTYSSYISGFAAATQRSLTITLQAGAPVLNYICYYHLNMGAAITNANDGTNTTALQLPVRTTTERIAMTGLSDGEMIFNSTTDKVEYWDGYKWYGITYEVTGESPYNNVLYTGTSSTNAITGVGFSPDLVWLKQRNSAQNHGLFDTVRGTNNFIMSNSASAENTRTTDTLSSFDADGFTLTPYSSDAFINYTGRTMVAWCFKAGGAAVANTDGNIASQVSANAAGGFSIVKWSGNDTTGGTIGHGLSSTPELTIIKKTSATANWQVSLNASVTGVEGYMNLDASAALYTTYPLYYTSSNSTVLSSNGTSTGTRLYNNQSANYIAYCFHSVAGRSKIGSYTGTGAGTAVPTGFEPAFVMIKKTSGYADWIIFDNKRGSNILKPNIYNSEVSLTNYITYNSTGFTFPTSDSNINIGDFIFMSFA